METELKYIIPAHHTSAAIRVLNQLCSPDPLYPTGEVSSIYFDTRDWIYLGEKRNSDYLKTKVRLRWYNPSNGTDGNSRGSFAEVKSKTGTHRQKLRIPTRFSATDLSAMELHDRALLSIPSQLVAVGAGILPVLFPTLLVRYTRRRFIERSTGTRIALDHGIECPKVNKYMLADPFQRRLPWSVLEIKGIHGTFPVMLQSILKLGFRRDAFSKYYESYRQLARMVY